jgi:hypothetical protein
LEQTQSPTNPNRIQPPHERNKPADEAVRPAMQAQRSPAMAGGGPGSAAGSPSPATVPVRRRCEGTAMGAVTLDLRPGLGVGPFTLGEFLPPTTLAAPPPPPRLGSESRTRQLLVFRFAR